jgi:hypothetical protein
MTGIHDTIDITPQIGTWFLWVPAALTILILALAVIALVSLRRRPMEDIPRFLWTLLIVFAPVFGPIAFIIANPGHPDCKA